MQSIEIRKATAELRSIWTIGNEYLQEAAPWSQFKDSPDRAGSIISFSFNLISLYANISRPFIPDTSKKIDEALNLDNNYIWPTSLTNFMTNIQTGHAFSVPDNLFEKLTDERISKFKAEFSGSKIEINN